MEYIERLKEKHWVGNSYRKPYIKQNPTKAYRRQIRRVQKQHIDDIIKLVNVEDYEIPCKREIVNDYDVIDYRYIQFPDVGSVYLVDAPKKKTVRKVYKVLGRTYKIDYNVLNVCK